MLSQQNRKRCWMDEEEEDEEHSEPEEVVQSSKKRAATSERLGAIYCDHTVVTRYADMTARWYNGFCERIFSNVKNITNFGAQIAVNFVDNSWVVYKNINDEEPCRRTDIPPDNTVRTLCSCFHTWAHLLL